MWIGWSRTNFQITNPHFQKMLNIFTGLKLAIIATNLSLMYRKSRISDHRDHSKHKQKMMHHIFRLPNFQLATCYRHQHGSDSHEVQDRRSQDAFQAQVKDDVLHSD